MSHDGNPFNFTRLMFTEVPTNYSYGPTYNPLPPGIGSEISIHPNGLQSESWLTGSVSSAVTPSLCQSPRCQEIRPRPAPTSPQPEIKKNISQREGMHAENTRRTVSGVAGRTNQPARRNEASAAKTPPTSSHDFATKLPRSRSLDYPQESPPQAHVEALQKALKAQVLHSLRALRKIVMDHRAFNLDSEIIDGWVAEVEGVDAKTIPIASGMGVQMFVPFARLNSILTKCITATGPMQSFTIRDQALELLKYILTYAEKYYLVQSAQVYFDIGRWIERLTQTNMRRVK